MKSVIFRLLFCSAVSLASLGVQAGGRVDVTFKDPQKFVDLQSTWLSDKVLLDGLSTHLQQLGNTYLPDGQVLQVEIADIDLAGSIEHTRRMSQVRVMRDVTSPRITLRYRFQTTDPTTPMTEETVWDAAYLSHINRYGSGDPLRYEKHMLEEWFRRTFASKPKP